MGSRRSRRVSWATGPNLCKVRLFISEDSPSQAGLRPQDNLQAKGSWLMHAAGPSSDDSLPPGFESLQPTNDLKIDISQIPLIRWKCPPHMLLDPTWCIVAGEESEEIGRQNERMFGVLEAIYPRLSNIPPNPFVSPDVKDSRYDDSQIPSVPLTPVEDDDASDQLDAPSLDLPNNYHQSDNYNHVKINLPQITNTLSTAAQLQSSGTTGALSSGLSAEPDLLGAASAVYTAMVQSNQKGSMVDPDLLVNILSDPAQVGMLMKEYGLIRHEQSTSSSVVAPMLPGPQPQMTASAPASYSNHMATLHNTNPTMPPAPPMMNPLMMNRPPSAISSVAPPMLNITNQPPSAIPSVASPMMHLPPGSSPAMNFSNAPLSYYKTLIHQHGGERKEPVEQNGMQYRMYHQPAPPQIGGIDATSTASLVTRDTKERVMKPCAYFNGPRGCRNGANCTFLHDASAPARNEQPKGSKRIKLDSRIAGRN